MGHQAPEEEGRVKVVRKGDNMGQGNKEPRGKGTKDSENSMVRGWTSARENEEWRLKRYSDRGREIKDKRKKDRGTDSGAEVEG